MELGAANVAASSFLSRSPFLSRSFGPRVQQGRPLGLREPFEQQPFAVPSVQTTVCGGVTTLDVEEAQFYHRSAHVASFVPEQSWMCSGWCFFRHLTICSMPHLSLQCICYLAWSAFVMWRVSQEQHYAPGGCAAPGNANNDICALVQQLEQGALDFRFLVAFLLAGLVSVTVARWQWRRTNYASLCGTVRNLLLQIASFLPIPDGEDAHGISELRMRLGRWVLLAYELAVLKARGSMDSDSGRAFLLKQRLATEEEWDSLITGDRHTTALFWVQAQLASLAREGVITNEELRACAEAISAMRAQANDLMSCLDRDLPFSYLTLSGFLVHINTFLYTTWKGVLWGTWLRGMGISVFSSYKLWFDVGLLAAWNVSYLAMFDLSKYLYNPFGDRSVDVAHEAISAGLRNLAMQLMEGVKALPPTFQMSSGLRARQIGEAGDNEVGNKKEF